MLPGEDHIKQGRIVHSKVAAPYFELFACRGPVVMRRTGFRAGLRLHFGFGWQRRTSSILARMCYRSLECREMLLAAFLTAAAWKQQRSGMAELRGSGTLRGASLPVVLCISETPPCRNSGA